jgi:HAD superfamily hydrolase (TIGR01490 family)
MSAQNSNRVHIFDVDYTLLKSSTSYYFLFQGLREKVFTARQLLRLPYEWLKYKMGLVDPDFIRKSVKFVAGIERSRLESLAERAFELRMKRNIFSRAAELIDGITSRGGTVCLATSSFDTLVKPLADFLGIAHTLASRLEFAGEKATGRIEGSAAFGEAKKNAVMLWLTEQSVPLERVSFYTDSYSDIPLLELCGNPVAVNPDWFLLRKAKKHGWKILRFKETLGVKISR